MANTSKGLGKGLAALLGDDVMDSGEEKNSLFLPRRKPLSVWASLAAP